MQYYSTANHNYRATLAEAVLTGMPPDSGLFMPAEIPPVSNQFLQNCHSMSFQELALEVALRLLGDDIPLEALSKIIDESINFDAPLIQLSENIYTLDLFHGPTLAFKDFGARFMSRLMAYLNRNAAKTLNILVATSGDTGSAVANGFYKVPGIQVIVLYPSGKISRIQEQQIATLDQNITAFEVKGTFDDCQKLVKTALTDREIKKQLSISSANSINIARLIPQLFYYFRAFGQLGKMQSGGLFISVPSGNFGNLTAGLMAKQMGLPVAKFVAATNINDVVPRYLQSGHFVPQSSAQTISSAMDVGNPSNFVRILDLYHQDCATINRDLSGYSFTDHETRQEILQVYRQTGYICDPHGAVGSLGLKKHLKLQAKDAVGIFLETAHPAKFKSIVEGVIDRSIEVPERLAKYLELPKHSIEIENNYNIFKAILLSNSTPQ